MAVFSEWMKGIPHELISGTEDVFVDDCIYDSRKAAPDKVFICIPGARADGHDFLKEVYAKGTRVFVVMKELSELSLPETAEDLTIVRVADSRKALASLAAARFGHPFRKLLSIGVTGTKGKTTATTMLKTVLENCGMKTGLIGTVGCFIGDESTPTRNTTPESYELQEDFSRMVEAGCKAVVMECSSQGFKLDRTYGLEFDYGVFLNISPDHIGPDEHKSFEEYMACKAMLLSQSKTAVVNADDPHTEEILRLCSKPERIVSFSASGVSDIFCTDIEYLMNAEFTGTVFRSHGLFEGRVKLPLPGFFNVQNTLPVLAVSALCGLPSEKVKEGILNTRVNGRMEVVARTDLFTIFVDYAHNEVSMVSLLKTLRENYGSSRLVVLFGCGGNRSKDRRIAMGSAAARSADFTVITSDNPRYEKPEDILEDIHAAYREAGGKEENCVQIVSRREAIRYAMQHAQPGDLIAVIGKGHEDYIEQNGVRTHFLDREVILEEMKALGL